MLRQRYGIICKRVRANGKIQVNVRFDLSSSLLNREFREHAASASLAAGPVAQLVRAHA